MTRRSLEDAIMFFETMPLDDWKTRDFIDYFYATQATYQNLPFLPSYNQQNRMIMGKLINLFGSLGTKQMIEGVFAFRDKIFYDDFLQKIGTHLTIPKLISVKLRPYFLEAMQLMKNLEAQQTLPRWRRVPQTQWTPADWEAWRANIGGLHAKG